MIPRSCYLFESADRADLALPLESFDDDRFAVAVIEESPGGRLMPLKPGGFLPLPNLPGILNRPGPGTINSPVFLLSI